MLKLAFLLFVLVSGFCPAQEKSDTFKVVYGRVAASGIQVPLPYAHIYSVKSRNGIVSNQSGEYVLKIPAHLTEDTVICSFMGYQTVRIFLQNLNAVQQVNLSLAANSIMLSEIVVRDMDAAGVMNEVRKNIPENYGRESYVTRGFYREWLQDAQNRRKYFYSEGVIDVLKQAGGFDGDSVKVVEGIIYQPDSAAHLESRGHKIPTVTEGPYVGVWLDATRNPLLFVHELANYKFRI